MFKKLCAAMLLVSLFALAGCPEVSQQGSGGSSGGRSESPD
jgi:predicted small secreted protein